MQPIVRGIQAVGSVSINYKYNSEDGNLPVPPGISFASGITAIPTGNSGAGVEVAGFRLDSEFLRAVQQIATSVMIPILGGGGMALTNNNRTGTLTINCSRVSTPLPAADMSGLANGAIAYDLVLLAQCQQAAAGGDSLGSTIIVTFQFSGKTTKVIFDHCTIAKVDPLALAGNNVPSYGVEINYLNWNCEFDNAA
jgi:hypothetical protein